MNILKYIIITAVLFIIFPYTAYATENEMISEQLKLFQVENINKTINQIQNEKKLYDSQYIKKFDFTETIIKAIKGEIDISPAALFGELIKSLLAEVLTNTSLMRNLIVITILAAILKSLSITYEKSEISEIAFYVSYIAVIIILFTSFTVVVSVAESLIDDISTIMQAMLPMFTALLMATGNVTTASVYSPLIVLASQFITSAVKDVLLPLIYAVAVLQIINYLTEKEILKNLTELAKKGISYSIRAISVLFMAVLTLQGISAPILNNVVGKGAKAVMGSIPVVGGVLKGAVDSIMYWTSAVKNGISVAAIIYVIMLCAAPIIKIASIMLIYKITAALVQPVSDERIVKCISSVGSFAGLVLSVCVTVAFTFIFSIAAVLLAAGI